MNADAEARIRQAVAELADAIVAAVDDGPSPAPDRLLSINEAAEATSLGRSKVYSLISTGELRSLRIGRRRVIPASAVAEFIKAAQA